MLGVKKGRTWLEEDLKEKNNIIQQLKKENEELKKENKKLKKENIDFHNFKLNKLINEYKKSKHH